MKFLSILGKFHFYWVLQIKRPWFQGQRRTFKQDAICIDNSQLLGSGVNPPNPSKFQLSSNVQNLDIKGQIFYNF